MDILGMSATPEHDKRPRGDGDIVDAYNYVDSVVGTNDLIVGFGPVWHGWALREAFLAGISHAVRQLNKTNGRLMCGKCDNCKRIGGYSPCLNLSPINQYPPKSE
jgi:hypothetical protein